MPDEKSKTGAQDRERIDLSEDAEVDDGSKRSGITAEELQAPVAAVGNDAAAAQAHLNRPKQ
jgi:Protein of unknown function (DUF3606)